MEIVTLKRKVQPVTIESPKEEKKKDKKKKLTNPFKKGSWKAFLYKRLKKHHTGKFVEDFHFTKVDNIMIYKKNKLKVFLFKKKLTKEDLEKLDSKSDCTILINTSNSIYTKISLKSYLKLMEIEKMSVEIDLDGEDSDLFDDPDDDRFDIYDHQCTIDNINSLCEFIDYYRNLITGVFEVQARCCWYTIYNFKVRIVLIKTDGTVKTYKSDMNDFMEDYGLKLF